MGTSVAGPCPFAVWHCGRTNRRREGRVNGLLVIDKPGGMTSRDAVNRVQRWFPRKTKIGHTGTLDPLATGVLVVCVGAATRLADYVQAMGKSYASRFRLGATSTTDDADGDVTETPDAVPPTREQIDAALAALRRDCRAGSAGVLGAEGRRSARPRPRAAGEGGRTRGPHRAHRRDPRDRLRVAVAGCGGGLREGDVHPLDRARPRRQARLRRAGANAPAHARRPVHGGAGGRARRRPRRV